MSFEEIGTVRGRTIASTILFLLLPALSLSQTAKANWQVEWEKTLEAAKREGKVVVSVPTSAELRKELEARFQKKFPGTALELSVARGASDIYRLVEVKKAGVRNYDLHIGGTPWQIAGPLFQHVVADEHT